MKKSHYLGLRESQAQIVLKALYFFGFVTLVLLCLNFVACDKFKHEKKNNFTYVLASSVEDSNELADSLTIEVLDSENEVIKISSNNEDISSKRPSILLFVQHDCKNCLAIAPHIVDLKQKYAKFINLFILTPASQNEQNIQAITSVLNAYAKNYPIYTPATVQGVNNDITSFLDKDISLGYVWLLNIDGTKVVDYAGLVPQEMLERDLLFVLHDTLNAEAQNILQDQESQDLSDSNESDLMQEHTHDEPTEEVQEQPKDSVNPTDFVESNKQNEVNK